MKSVPLTGVALKFANMSPTRFLAPKDFNDVQAWRHASRGAQASSHDACRTSRRPFAPTFPHGKDDGREDPIVG